MEVHECVELDGLLFRLRATGVRRPRPTQFSSDVESSILPSTTHLPLWAARLSSSAVSELEMTARASIGVLQTRPGAAFRRLLMTRTTLWRKCDAFVQVRARRVLRLGSNTVFRCGCARPKNTYESVEGSSVPWRSYAVAVFTTPLDRDTHAGGNR